MSRTLTIEQAAAKLQVKPNTVRRWIKHGRIPGCKIGRIFRISEADLDRVLSGESMGKPALVSEVRRAALGRGMRNRRPRSSQSEPGDGLQCPDCFSER
jgi:excisionase family DNA binding protein